MQFTAATFALLATRHLCVRADGDHPHPVTGSLCVRGGIQPFNLTFASQRIFKESSNKIDVVISSLGGGFPGAAPVRDLAPTAHDSDSRAIYSVMVDPMALCCGGVAGNCTIYVLEDYNAFGMCRGLPGLAEIAVPVTFV
ncbi:hypothetical protein C8R45DRAFT_1108938 [Mycena sanguinolenta]|nr:hypothetical protein C8R45DRAFT_1108938 [Mycena sanguinolenta]